MRNIIIAIVVIVLLLGGVFVVGRQSDNKIQVTTTFTIGQKAADFTLRDFDGKEVRLSEFYGQKAVILDFWAAWCPFCVAEMPELEKTQQAYKDQLVMVGIHRTDSGESIVTGKKFADEQGVTYLLLQGTGEIYRASTKGLQAMPVAIFIDKEGVVRDIKLGPKTEGEIREKVEKLVRG